MLISRQDIGIKTKRMMIIQNALARNPTFKSQIYAFVKKRYKNSGKNVSELS